VSGGKYDDVDGDDLQIAVRELQECLALYWRWVNLLDDGSPIGFSGDILIEKMNVVRGIIREFQSRYREDPSSGWNI